MKAFKTQAVIGGVRARVDNSIGLTISTPELTPDEAIAIFRLKGQNVNILIEPEDGSDSVVEVKSELETKSSSQRLRSVIFIYWKQQGLNRDFEGFYRMQMEKLIEHYKDKLEQ